MTAPETVDVQIRQHTIFVRCTRDSYGFHRAEWVMGGHSYEVTDITRGLALVVAENRMRRIDAYARGAIQ